MYRTGPASHEDHLCAVCGAKRGAHSGPNNPHAPNGACPSGAFPKWPSTIRDEARAGMVFDRRVRTFWQASRSTFQPRG